MVLNRFLSLFLENKCPLCDRGTDSVLCWDCQTQLRQCQFHDPTFYWHQPLPLFVWGQYEGTLKRAIAALKYDNHPQLGTWLGHHLGQAWRKSFPHCPPLTIVPIPLHVDKRNSRGFNQAESIAQQFARVNGFTYMPDALIRVKATEALFGLALRQRQLEMQGAFRLSKTIQQQLVDRPVLIVDDIYTSGTTSKEAHQCLTAHDIAVYGVAAVATPMPGA